MALKTTDQFYIVTFKPTSAAAWASMLVPPGIPPALAPYVVNGTNCPIYVIDSATGTFAFPGGQAYGFTDDLLATASSALSQETISSEQGLDVVWSKDGAGNAYSYAPSTGALSTYTVSEAGDLKSFLP